MDLHDSIGFHGEFAVRTIHASHRTVLGWAWSAE
jgi:hypothetical protein